MSDHAYDSRGYTTGAAPYNFDCERGWAAAIEAAAKHVRAMDLVGVDVIADEIRSLAAAPTVTSPALAIDSELLSALKRAREALSCVMEGEQHDSDCTVYDRPLAKCDCRFGIVELALSELSRFIPEGE